MNILGISAYFHDSAACLLRDGSLVMHVEEERLNREKHTARFPELALGACLRAGDIGIDQIDAVAFNWDVFAGARAKVKLLLRYLPRSLNLMRAGANPHGMAKSHLDGFRLKRYLVEQFGLPQRVPLHRVNHHLTHAASAFLISPFDEAAILTLDAVGDDCATAAFAGRGTRIEPVQSHGLLDSLGVLYSVVTQFLGFRTLFDEGKVMALAAYGEPRYLGELRRIVRLGDDGRYKLDLSFFRFQFNGELAPFSPKFYRTFGPPRKPGAPIEQRHNDIAASLQSRLEEVTVGLASHLYGRLACENLCLAGGVALNCLSNTQILRHTPFERLWVPPVPNDSGGALGAALYAYHSEMGNPRKLELRNAYWGPEYHDDEIESALALHGVQFERRDDATFIAAEIVANGGILGWFQGRMEIGPRALGNRSIVADPRRADMKDIMNQRIKHRESFRPFAPSVLAEAAHEYFDLVGDSPFMVMSAEVRREKRAVIPAVIHIDGTARLQTVTREDCPRYWELIDKFRRLTGVPLILNTSFNENEPIVCSPEDAICCFLRTPMDALVIGDYVVRK